MVQTLPRQSIWTSSQFASYASTTITRTKSAIRSPVGMAPPCEYLNNSLPTRLLNHCFVTHRPRSSPIHITGYSQPIGCASTVIRLDGH